MSTEDMVDFNQISSNFLFKEVDEASIFNFYNCIDKILFDDSNYNNEITDSDRLKSAINYYCNEIHTKWQNLYRIKLLNNEI
jgi:hypothetical protein